MIEIIIDGNNFSNMVGFYDEVERKLTKDLDWKIGRNLNAFNDVLWGGFCVHDYEEPFTLIWENAEKSKKELNTEAAEKHDHTAEIFEVIIDIIKSHEHITLRLQ